MTRTSEHQIKRQLLNPLQDELSTDPVAHVVAELRAMTRAASLELALNIGHLIIEKFYDGNVDTWRSKGDRNLSFRKLISREDLPISVSGLYRALAIYELTQRLGMSSWRQLGVSHLRAVLSLPPDQQRILLEDAEREGWTVIQLESKVSDIRRQKPASRRGRPPLPRFVKTIRHLKKYVEAPEERFADLEALRELERPEVAELLQTISRLRDQCETLERKLKNRLVLVDHDDHLGF